MICELYLNKGVLGKKKELFSYVMIFPEPSKLECAST